MKAADLALQADTYDAPATLAAIRNAVATRGPIHGCLCLGSDVPHSVAAVTSAFSLPGIPVASASIAMNKRLMKDLFSQKGIPLPEYRSIWDSRQLRQAMDEWRRVVLKPCDSRGARGVLLLDDSCDVDSAISYSRSFSPRGSLLVERFLDGPQLSTEGLVIKGVLHSVGFSDRNYARLAELAPHIVEDGGELPSKLPDSVLHKTHEVLCACAAALQMETGVLKGDIVIHQGQPHVIEVATRLSGGYFCSHEIPFSTGVDFLGQAIRLALGEIPDPTDLQPKCRRVVVQRYLFPSPGKVVEIRDLDPTNHPLLWYREIRVKCGDIIHPIRNHPARAGLVMTTGATREEALAAAQAALASLIIHTV
jgi:biotin carboxylase